MTTVLINDPMMALISATHARSQGATEDLAALAEDQKANNEKQKALRALESKLREFVSKGQITRQDAEGLRQTAHDLGVNINSQIDSLEALMVGDHPNHLAIGGVGSEDWQVERKNLIDAIKEEIGAVKENIKAEATNKELDMQRATQELTAAMQLESTISKKWSDTGNAIIHNMA